jgi:hypothetical protein
VVVATPLNQRLVSQAVGAWWVASRSRVRRASGMIPLRS